MRVTVHDVDLQLLSKHLAPMRWIRACHHQFFQKDLKSIRFVILGVPCV